MIYVIRHGQTDLNQEGRLQGRRGRPLNEAGMIQAQNAKEALCDIHFDYVFSSPQERAVQTAEIISGKEVKVDERLDVFDLGEADGLLKTEVKMSGYLPDQSVYEGIENKEDFMGRIFSFMDELQGSLASKDVNILISGHRCTTGGIGAYFKGIPTDLNILQYSSNNGEFKTYRFK
ncbi:histidine phosphatase family protein [Bacillus sp. KH172YL63]|uniref:histidine phosphatase family protein n=1 Tax=Bacillus sp. KH172YL63 TaxID=2709784 RepID=UPI001565B4AA|nr:histidine phosphatase family protein [Bacillus sp. KH172YL63]